MKAVVLDTIVRATLALPNPTPEQPPGTEDVVTVLNWISWIVIVAGLAGFLISAGTLAFAAYTGREVNSFKGIVLAIMVCILASSAGVIMQVFI